MLRPPLKIPAELPGNRLHLQGFELDLDARELHRGGARRGKRLTAKAQQVLLTLALRPGEVISREALMDAVWPDSYPTGDVLTQAIVALRRALDDDADTPRFIETIARSGYRLLGEVHWATAPQPRPVLQPPPPPTPGSKRPRPRRGLAVAASCLLASVLVIGAWSLLRPTPTGDQALTQTAFAERELVLAATPAYEGGPVMSPDGRQFVFLRSSWEAQDSALQLQSTAEFIARPLTRPPPGWSDLDPAWSPDQQWVAFRRQPGSYWSGGCELRQVSVIGGEERLIGPCLEPAIGLAYTPDGRGLIVGGRRLDGQNMRGLRRIDLASGAVQPIPIDEPIDDWTTGPRVSADGRWLMFRRGTVTAELFRLPIEGGKAEPLTGFVGDLRGHDWLGGDGALVLSLVDARGMWVYRMDGPLAALKPLVNGALHPRSSAAGQQVVFQTSRTAYRIQRVSLEDGTVSAPEALSSSRNDLLPSPAPDASQLAFYSDRTGTPAVWLHAMRQPAAAPRRVDGLVPKLRFAPVWSADSRHLLVAGDGEAGDGLYEIDAASLRARRIPLAGPVGAAIYLDARRVLVNRMEQDGYRLGLYAREDGQALGQRQLQGLGFMQFDPVGQRILYAREDQPGLWAASLDLEELGILRGSLPLVRHYRAWRILDGHLWWLHGKHDGSDFALYRLQLADIDGEPERVMDLPSEGTLVPDLGLSQSTEGLGLWRTEQSLPQADIAMLTFSSNEAAPDAGIASR